MQDAADGNAGALKGITVLDLTRVLAGPFCTLMLGDMGAEVIKVEEPGKGDDSRAFGPPFVGGEAAYYLSINRNKKSITLNLKSPRGKEVLRRLIAKADVLVENFRPGTMEKLGFGYEALKDERPDLIYCSISGFGSGGPDAGRPGYDLIVQGECGVMDLTGDPEGPPTKVGTPVADLVSGLMAAQGITLALFARQRTGRGQYVEIAMLDAMASLLAYNAGIFFATGKSPTRRGNQHATIVPYETFRAADGYVNIAAANDSLFVKLCDVIERPDLAKDPRFDKAPKRVESRADLIPLLNQIVATRPRADWIARLSAAGIPCGQIRTVAEVCESPQLISRGMIVEQAHATAGMIKTMGPPIKLGDTPAGIRLAPPTLGEHTADILGGMLGLSAAEIEELKASGAI